MTPDLIDISPDVADALSSGRPVVALESTIITHGMPAPQNVETARAVEDEVRAAGAVPATIAILDGRAKVGLDAAALDRLGAAEGVVKASGRDLGAVIAKGLSAGTTVSATMRLAHLAGIGIFATGGVGGVHRGAEVTMDISADLMELATTPVSVVCAGVKSILDISRTLEVLETNRVPVIANGTEEFPAFFSRQSGIAADHRLDGAEEIARAIAAHHAFGSGTGLLIANPIPADDEIPAAEIAATIDEALKAAESRGISRKEVTPFLLSAINEATSGRSLTANIALVRNNARLAAEIAVAAAR
ncbi:pseudouridine-5'-phosphate glycosidase [Roseicyclus sp. F158]|uniref:Pseudouridine-5'-phosphate glycosidase n=1 Tax=Tropicimonas omnivorans TaxID=3075590 RepID=A0ABU3DFN8_9RHOB|nr:pseudouridine-5'-phosphate glycosidase [Roseicyclus sp. F158]MDT0682535.1 pseudouridine-5'-phosphate glycosidase [Roseicyclus sp. F158]